MKKKALIKLIDTYIRQLQEIRNDVNSMITEDTADLTQCSNEGAAKYIVSIIKDRSEDDINQILKEVALRMMLLTGENISALNFGNNDNTEAKTIHYIDICKVLSKSDIMYSVDNTGDGRRIVITNKSGKELMAYFFNKDNELIKIGFNSYCMKSC